MIIAPMTPGTHPHRVSSKTNKKDPHPLSITAIGGRNIQIKALGRLIVVRAVR